MKKILLNSLLLFTTLISINAPLHGMPGKRKLQENKETDKQNKDKKRKASTTEQSINDPKLGSTETLLEMEVEPTSEPSASASSGRRKPNRSQQANILLPVAAQSSSSASSTSPSLTQPTHASSKSDVYVGGDTTNLPEETIDAEMPHFGKRRSKTSSQKRSELKEQSLAKDVKKEYKEIIKHYGIASDVSMNDAGPGKRIPSNQKLRPSSRDDRDDMKNMREKIANKSAQSSSDQMNEDEDTMFENELEKRAEEYIEIAGIKNPNSSSEIQNHNNNSNEQEAMPDEQDKFAHKAISTAQEKNRREQTKKDAHAKTQAKNSMSSLDTLLTAASTDLLTGQATKESNNAALADAIEGNNLETVSSLLEDKSTQQLLKGENGQKLIRTAEDLTDSFSTSSARNVNEQIIAILKNTREKFQTGTPESFLRMRTQATASAQNACNLIEAAGNGKPIQNNNYEQRDINVALTLINQRLRIIGNNANNNKSDATIERNWYTKAKKVIEALQKSVQPASKPTAKKSSAATLEQKENSENINSTAQTSNPNPSSSSSNQMDDSTSSLMVACQNGESKAVERSLANGANVHAKSSIGCTALHYAAANNSALCIKVLLEAGASINATATDGKTPLMVACASGSLAAVKRLLKNGANIDAKDNLGKSALDYVVGGNHGAIAQLLLAAREIHTDKTQDYTKLKDEFRTMLQTHLRNFFINECRPNPSISNIGIRLMTDDIGNFVSTNLTINTLTFNALLSKLMDKIWSRFSFFNKSQEAHDKITAEVKKFLEKNLPILLRLGLQRPATSVNTVQASQSSSQARQQTGDHKFSTSASSSQNDSTTNQLMIACQNGDLKTVEQLLENGADIHAKNSDGWTALDYAIWQNQDIVTQYLLSKGALIDATTNDNFTPLMLACRFSSPKIVQLLLQNKANVHAKNQDEWTALHFAAKQNQDAIIKLLLEAGALIDVTETGGCTPLMIACQHGSLKAVQQLLKNGANIHAKDSHGYTTLHWATQENQAATVKLLFNTGAYTADEYQAALAHARECNSDDVVTLLLSQDTSADIWTIGTRLADAFIVSEQKMITDNPPIFIVHPTTQSLRLANNIKILHSCSKHKKHKHNKTTKPETNSASSSASATVSFSAQESTSQATTQPSIPEAWSTFVETVIIDVCISTLNGYHKIADDQMRATVRNQLLGLYPTLGQLNTPEAFINVIMNILMNNLSPLVSRDMDEVRTDLEDALCTLLKRNNIISKLQTLSLGFELKAAAEVEKLNKRHDDDDDNTPGAMSSYERKQWQKVVGIKPDSFMNSHATHWGLTALMTLGTHAAHKHMVPGQKIPAHMLAAASAA